MPWNTSDVNRHKKGLSPRKKRQWIYVANGALKRGLDEATAIRMANSTVNRTKAVSPNIGGGVDRATLRDSDFAISGERKFPVVIPKDVKDAVSSWGRYKGPVSFETFKKNLIALARRKGSEFVKALPASWEDQTGKAARYSHIDFQPPEGARLAAKRGLALRKEFGRGGTAIGVARARDLSNGANISPDTIKRMKSYFARHAADKRAKDWGNASNPSAGYIAWLLWGGDAGRAWANKVARQLESADRSMATKEYDGVMICFRPSEEVAKQLALSPGQDSDSIIPPDKLHLTLCYPGDASGLEPYKNIIIAALAEFASHMPPVMARVGGTGRFLHESDDKTAFYAQIDSLNIQAWRRMLVERISQFLPYQDRFGFVPHITLAYPQKNKPSPAVMLEPLEMVFDSVWLAWGDEYTEFPLTGILVKAVANEDGGGKGYGARKGEVIRGNLARGEGGKFVAAGNAPAAATPTVSKPKPAAGYKRPEKPKATTKKPASKKAPAVNAAQREAERQQMRAKREAERQADRAKREAERQADRAKRAAEREEDRQKKAAAAAGKAPKAPKGGGESKQTAAEKRRAQQSDNRRRVISEMEGKGGLPSKLAESLIDLFEGDSPDESTLEALVAEGVAKKTDQGAYILSPAGVTYVHSLNKGNAETATRALERARKSRTKRKEFTPGLTVFKDRNGQYRWVLYSSNAYKDRDGEIISQKALEAECARSDRDGMYGPLRWWHVGKPNPVEYPDAPWGPGADLGMCDFRAMRGRVLVESGTFKSDQIAEAIAEIQEYLRGSIGLMHPMTEPTPEDGAHVFHNIFIFERSLLPAGKESNPFTRVHVYDERKRKMEQKKLEALRSLVGESVANEIIGGADATQKEADAQGVLFKAQREGELDTILATFGAALKQYLSPAVESAPEIQEAEKAYEEEMKAEEEVVEEVSEEDMAEEAYVADMTMTEFKDMLASAFQEAVAPLLDMETKMRGLGDGMKGNAMLLEELKAALGMTRQKEAEVATMQTEQAGEIATLKEERDRLQAQMTDLQTKLAQVDARTKELAGEVPAGFQAGYQASTDPNTALQTRKEGTSQYPSQTQAINGFLDGFLGSQTNGH